jgi:hypothetical protein
MEEWEVLLREKLELEIPEGIYSIEMEGKKYLTGRNGIIDYLVYKEREVRLSGNK